MNRLVCIQKCSHSTQKCQEKKYCFEKNLGISGERQKFHLFIQGGLIIFHVLFPEAFSYT